MKPPSPNTPSELLAYYDSIVPDTEACRAALSRPLPTSLSVNTLKISRDACLDQLRKLGMKANPMPWNTTGIKLPQAEVGIGRHWMYQAGLYQTQEEVSLIPAIVLNPQPGESVLDLCAAPGGKTAQMSVMMQNTGTIVANDRNYGRLRAMGHIIKRLGLSNIATTALDGTSYPALREYFDCVLADVPCRCEGTWRKHRRNPPLPNRKQSLAMSRIQYQLLEKAVQLTRPGGRIVYSTCTFAPEENERVLDRLIQSHGDSVEILPIQLPGLICSPGITEWAGEHYHGSVENAIRLWPHQNDTGGFFIALIQKKNPTTRFPYQPSYSQFSDISSPDVRDFLLPILKRFGIDPMALSGYQFSANNHRGIYWMPPSFSLPDNLPTDAAGLFAIKTKIKHPKLSTPAAMWLAPKATRHCLDLSAAQRDAFLSRAVVPLSPDQAESIEESGYIMVRYDRIGLGLGLVLIYTDGPPTLESLFPKAL